LAIATKKGLVEVLVIRVTPIAPAEPAGVEPPGAELPAGAELPLGLLQATNRRPAMATAAALLGHLPRVDWFTWSSSVVPAAGVGWRA
jgi:hypothetical protein